MKKSSRYQHNRGALELIEEATHLLRSAPVGLTATYAIGALPFVLGLLFFVADMGSNPFAKEHVIEAALGMSILFLWMKVWQALFARKVLAQVTGVAPAPLDVRSTARILAAQVAFQPLGLILIPIAAVLTVPFAWVYSCFQNLTVLADGNPMDFRQLFRRAWKQSALSPADNQALKFTMFGFTLVVFLNWTILGAVTPKLLKMLLGIETVFSRSPWSLFNTTFFAAMAALTYLSVDPILKIIHVLRCFYGEAQTDGADLKAELRRAQALSQSVATVLLTCILVFHAGGSSARAESPAPAPSVESNLNLPDLDRAIHEVVAQRKYVWRMPREETVAPTPDAKPGMIEQFLERAARFVGKVVLRVVQAIDSMLRRIFSGWNPKPISPDTGFTWIAFQRLMLYLLGAAVIVAGLLLAFRIWRSRRGREEDVIEATPVVSVPDLTDENIGADQLPEDGWTRLAREMWDRGEFRLALRAFYLASLAQLAARQLITLARAKSNREYQRELQRRSHAVADLLPPFEENLGQFERVWYGTHPASDEGVARFAANVERMRTLA